MSATFDEEELHPAAHPGEARLDRVRSSQLDRVRGVVQDFGPVGQIVPDAGWDGPSQRPWIDTIDVSGVEWQRHHGFRASPHEMRHQRSPQHGGPPRSHRNGHGRLREEERYHRAPQAPWRLWLVHEGPVGRLQAEEVQKGEMRFPVQPWPLHGFGLVYALQDCTDQ